MADWPSVASALAATGGLIFTGAQQVANRRELRRTRQAELRGVTVSWILRESPPPSLAGVAQFLYEFMVHNPGDLPIHTISVVVDLGTTVIRIHHNGVRAAPSSALQLHMAVLPGHSHRPWMRRIELDLANRSALDNMAATISFESLRDGPQTSRWPPGR